MRKETKIGNTNYIVNGSYRAVGAGISLSSALFRLMEKDLQGKEALPEQNSAINMETGHHLRYNGNISQEILGCKLQTEGVFV